jgi:hypothetical protein
MTRIGFMKFYQSPKPSDRKPIVGGASYNADGIDHEAYNFLDSMKSCTAISSPI